jgi:ribosomal protein L32
MGSIAGPPAVKTQMKSKERREYIAITTIEAATEDLSCGRMIRQNTFTLDAPSR